MTQTGTGPVPPTPSHVDMLREQKHHLDSLPRFKAYL